MLYGVDIFDCMATEYGKRLRTARKHAGLTQEKLASLVGVGQSAIAGLERIGHGSAYTHQIATECNVNPLWLATGEGQMEMPASELSHLALDIAHLFDTLPQDRRVRAVAFGNATQAILQAARDVLPTHTPDPLQRQESQSATPPRLESPAQSPATSANPRAAKQTHRHS